MKLATGAGYWSAGPPDGAQESILQAERLGFHSFWTAEAYGSDALTPLAWWGAATSTIQLGTGIVQMSARTPAATAMAAITMDHLSGGRFILGLGVSGPQVVEGWYGQPYPKPLARTREYVDIVRQVFAREAPVTFDGAHYQLPLDGGAGLGKALKPTVHPYREDLPIYLAAEGPKNVALAAEICGLSPPFENSSTRFRSVSSQTRTTSITRRVGRESPCSLAAMKIAAPQSPVGLRPMVSQSRVMDCTSLSAVRATACALEPKLSLEQKRRTKREGSSAGTDWCSAFNSLM